LLGWVCGKAAGAALGGGSFRGVLSDGGLGNGAGGYPTAVLMVVRRAAAVVVAEGVPVRRVGYHC